MNKRALVLGAGGFIGNHLVNRLKKEGYWVRGVDVKQPEYQTYSNADEFMLGDLKETSIVDRAFSGSGQHSLQELRFDEVYQLAADMGGAGYIFSGENDANVMHNSALINLNVAHAAVQFKAQKIFYSSSACMYPEHNQLDPDNPNCEESSAYSGEQTRSFLYIDECLEGVRRLMESDFTGPVNIGSDEMVTINQLVDIACSVEGKKITKKHIDGPLGVAGRNSDNKLIKDKINWAPDYPLNKGIQKTYKWIKEQINYE